MEQKEYRELYDKALAGFAGMPRKEINAEAAHLSVEQTQYTRELAAKTAECERLREALRKYSQHGDCKKADFDYKPCTCGLEEELKTLGVG